MDRLFHRIKTLILNVYPYSFPCRNTNALIYSHMCSQSNPVKKAALLGLRFAEVHAFFKPSLREGSASDESLAEVFTV